MPDYDDPSAEIVAELPARASTMQKMHENLLFVLDWLRGKTVLEAITGSGTYTVPSTPAEITHWEAVIDACGGGAGGDDDNAVGQGGGGGAGYCAGMVLLPLPGDTFDYAVGAAGAHGDPPTAGGTTTLEWKRAGVTLGKWRFTGGGINTAETAGTGGVAQSSKINGGGTEAWSDETGGPFGPGQSGQDGITGSHGGGGGNCGPLGRGGKGALDSGASVAGAVQGYGAGSGGAADSANSEGTNGGSGLVRIRLRAQDLTIV